MAEEFVQGDFAGAPEEERVAVEYVDGEETFAEVFGEMEVLLEDFGDGGVDLEFDVDEVGVA